MKMYTIDMDEEKSYQQRMEEQFRRLSRKIDEVLSQAENKARSEYQRRSPEIRAKTKEAREKLDELKTASGDAWKDLKPGFEKAWTELRKAFDEAASRFKRPET
ncbi:MAG: coiled coil domain-containing protein [Acidobacteriota bacterium]